MPKGCGYNLNLGCMYIIFIQPKFARVLIIYNCWILSFRIKFELPTVPEPVLGLNRNNKSNKAKAGISNGFN